mgnify:CR=1 FL=1
MNMKHKSTGLLVLLLLLLVLYDTFQYTRLSSSSPEVDKKCTQIPLKVNVMEGADKDIPGETRAAKMRAIVNNVAEINKNFKNCEVNVRFQIKLINWDIHYPEGVDPSDGLDAGERKKVRAKVRGELEDLKEFQDGKGAKITLVEKIEPNILGKTIVGDMISPIVDTEGGADDTWKHELGHGFGLPDKNKTTDKNNFMYGFAVGQTGFTVDPDQKKKIEKEAQKAGDPAKSKSKSEIDFEPIPISRSWELDTTDDVFYLNGTLATGYSYVDIAEVKSYSEEPPSTREFEIFVDGLFPENVSMIIPIRLCFDTDDNNLTGFYGYDKMLLINMTGSYPFTEPQSLEVIDPVTNTTIYQTTSNVSVIREYESVKLKLPAPPPPDYPVNDYISFNLTSQLLSTLNFTATNINTLLLIEDQTATVIDNLAFTFSTLPEQLPTLDVTEHSVSPGTVIGLTGSGFTPLGNVSLYLDDLMIGTVLSNGTGGITTNITIPDVPSGGYCFLTAIDPVNLDSAFTILIVIVHDISISYVTPSKTIVGQGFKLNIDVTVVNQGTYTETFNVTVYANTTGIGTQTVNNMLNETSIVLTFTWNTTGFAYGNYTIKAYATPVPDETDTTDNTHINDIIFVTIPGDANGDGNVNAVDFGMLGYYWFNMRGYDPRPDFNGDGFINAIDFGILGKYWFQHI